MFATNRSRSSELGLQPSRLHLFPGHGAAPLQHGRDRRPEEETPLLHGLCNGVGAAQRWWLDLDQRRLLHVVQPRLVLSRARHLLRCALAFA